MDTLLRVGVANSGWAAALALIAWCAARLCRRRPALAHALWLLVLLKLVTPSLVAVRLPAPTVPARTAFVGAVPSAPGHDRHEVPIRVGRAESPAGVAHEQAGSPTPVAETERATHGPLRGRLLAAGWAAGVLAWWLAVGLHTLRFRRFLGSAQPASAELRGRAERLAARLGLRACPTLGLVPARIPPMLWALFGRPRLLLPQALWERLSETQQDTVLLHELAHLKRGDHWVRRLEVIVLSLHWWNPLAWWARREIERAEEPCCDAWVTWALPDAVHDYAEALVATAAFLSGPRPFRPVGASGAGRTRHLKRRLTALMSDSGSGSAQRSTSKTLLLAVVLLLPLLPVWIARAAEDGKEAPPSPAAAPKSGSTRPSEGKAERPAPEAAPANPDDERDVSGKLVRPIMREGSDYEQFTGRLEPVRSVDFFARSSGAITEVHLQSGSAVKRGDLIFEIDPRVHRAELDRAEAELQRTQARRPGRIAALARAESLQKRGADFVSKEEVAKCVGDVEEVEAEIRAAQATRDLAKLKLESARVTSPIDGRVTFILPQGNVVVADKTLVATVVSLDPIAVGFDVDERLALRIGKLVRAGKLPGAVGSELPVLMALADESDFPHRGKVLSLNTVFDPMTGTTRWRALVPNADQSLVPGLFARVRVATSAPFKALVIPRSLVGSPRAGEYYVTVLLGDGVTREVRAVKLGRQQGDMIEVLEGLSPKERIIASAF